MKNDTTQKFNQSINTQLQVLLDEARSVVKEIDETVSDYAAKFNKIDANVKKSITAVEKICSELDQIEKKTGDEIDKLVLQQAEALAEE